MPTPPPFLNLATADNAVTVAATFFPPTPTPPPTVLAPSRVRTPAFKVRSAGLNPSASIASGSAPLFASTSMAPSCALRAARCSGVRPFSGNGAFNAARSSVSPRVLWSLAMSNESNSFRPFRAARWMGVHPVLVGTVGDTPSRRRDSHVPTAPRAHAQCIGSSPWSSCSISMMGWVGGWSVSQSRVPT